MANDIILNPNLKKYRKNAFVLKLVENKKDISKKDFTIYDGYLINGDETNIRSFVASLKQKQNDKKMLIGVFGKDDLFNRRILETIKVDYLVSPERIDFHQKDTLKQRDSGFNHVLAKIAKEKKVSIVVNFSEIADLSNKTKKEKATSIAKIIQNIEICKKAGCEIKIATLALDKKQLRSAEMLKSFGFSLGMSSQIAKNCVEFNKNI